MAYILKNLKSLVIPSLLRAAPAADHVALTKTGFLAPESKSLVGSNQPVRHGTAGSYGTREWLICRHWAVPVPSFYGPLRVSLLNGEPVGVRKVFTTFKRLESGNWIRAIGGRHHRIYLRSPIHRAAMRKHVMCTNGQNKRLDLMVRAHMRQPKYYVDDPYKPYQRRYGLDDFYYQPKEYLP